MMRTQPAGFRWLAGGFALLATIAFGLKFVTDDDKPALVFAVICLAIAGYWLLFDRDGAEAGGLEDPAAAETSEQLDGRGNRLDRPEC